MCPKEQDILLAQRNASAAPPSPTHTEERNTLSFLCVFLMAQAKGPLSLPWLLELLRQPSFPPLTSVFWRRACLLSHVQLFVTPQTAAHQAPLSTGFSRQQYWSGLSSPPLGDSSQPWDQTHDCWIGKTPWRRAWQPTPVLLPGESRGRRSLVGYSPWGREESDTTERLNSYRNS